MGRERHQWNRAKSIFWDPNCRPSQQVVPTTSPTKAPTTAIATSQSKTTKPSQLRNVVVLITTVHYSPYRHTQIKRPYTPPQKTIASTNPIQKKKISGDTLSPAVTVCRIPVEGWLLTVRSRSLKRKSGASVKCRFGNLTTLLLLLRLLLLCRVFISRARVTRFFNLQTLCLSWPSLFCPQGGGFILILPTSSTFPVKPSFFLFLFLSIPGSLCLRIFWCGLVDSGWFIGLGCVLLLYLMTSWSGSSSFRLYSWYLLLFWSVSIT